MSESMTPQTAAHQAPLSINSQSLLKLMSIELMMPSNHLILCRPLLLLPQSFPASGSFPMSQLLLNYSLVYKVPISKSNNLDIHTLKNPIYSPFIDYFLILDSRNSSSRKHITHLFPFKSLWYVNLHYIHFVFSVFLIFSNYYDEKLRILAIKITHSIVDIFL